MSNAGTCTKLPKGIRRIGRQCFGRGSGPVVADGVTTIQGAWETRRQGLRGLDIPGTKNTKPGSNMLSLTRGDKSAKMRKQPELERRMW